MRNCSAFLLVDLHVQENNINMSDMSCLQTMNQCATDNQTCVEIFVQIAKQLTIARINGRPSLPLLEEIILQPAGTSLIMELGSPTQSDLNATSLLINRHMVRTLVFFRGFVGQAGGAWIFKPVLKTGLTRSLLSLKDKLSAT